jgi:hypothetical protein
MHPQRIRNFSACRAVAVGEGGSSDCRYAAKLDFSVTWDISGVGKHNTDILKYQMITYS